MLSLLELFLVDFLYNFLPLFAYFGGVGALRYFAGVDAGRFSLQLLLLKNWRIRAVGFDFVLSVSGMLFASQRC